MSELRTCPFCGEKPREIAKANVNGMPGHEYIHRVVCSICSCRDDDILIQFVGTGPDKAAAADVARKEWNRRPLEEALEARVRELEAENEKLKNVDHFTPIEAAGVFVKKTLMDIAELSGIELDKDAFAIQYFCPHCGQKSKSKEEMLAHDAECFGHPAVLKVKRLEAELAQAKAAAVQWITYTGKPETLPDEEKPILVNGRAGVFYRVDGEDCYWCVEERQTGYVPTWRINIGDRWAYLPGPPEEE